MPPATSQNEVVRNVQRSWWGAYGKRTRAPIYGRRAEHQCTGHVQANKGAPEPSTTVMSEVLGVVSMDEATHDRGWVSCTG